MKRVLSNEVMGNLNIQGLSRGISRKTKFADTKIFRLSVYNAVLHKFPKTTETEFYKKTQNILRNAPTRKNTELKK